MSKDQRIDAPKGLSGAFVRGVIWTWVGQYGQYVVSLGVVAILARKLTPADFGLVSMVLIYTGFLSIVAESGIPSAIVQIRGLSTEDLGGIFAGTVLFGFVLWGLAAATGPLVEWFFEQPGTAKVAAALGASVWFGAMGMVPQGILRRDLRFKSLAGARLAAVVVSGTVAITAALYGLGYWALVLQYVTASLVAFAVMARATGGLPRVRLSLAPIRRVVGYSAHVMGFNTVNYWARSADNLLIGKYLGAGSLGYYGQAYRLMLIVVSSLAGVANQPLHPVLSRIRDDMTRFRTAYLRVLRAIASLSFPIGFFFIGTARPLVRILLGPGWETSADILSVLGVVAAIQPAMSINGSIFLALGRPEILFRLGLVSTALIVVSFVIGLRYGLMGVTVAYTATSAFLVAPLIFALVKRLCGLTLWDLVKAMGLPALVSAALLSAVVLLERFGPPMPFMARFGVNGVIFAMGALALVLPVAKTILGRRLDGGTPGESGSSNEPRPMKHANAPGSPLNGEVSQPQNALEDPSGPEDPDAQSYLDEFLEQPPPEF